MVVIMVLSIAVSVRRKNIKKKRALRRFLETEVRGEVEERHKQLETAAMDLRRLCLILYQKSEARSSFKGDLK